MSTAPRRVPSEAEWQRLDNGFRVLFLVTVAVALGFVFLAPFPPIVSLVLMAPLVGYTGWVWIAVIRARDADRLQRLNSFASRHRRRRRPRRP